MAKKPTELKGFSVEEVSLVPKGANPGAKVLLMKRAPEEVDKADVATSSVDGHQHGVEFRVYEGKVSAWVSRAMKEGESEEHSHELVLGPDGQMTLTENDGHTHSIDVGAVQMALINLAKADLSPSTSGHASLPIEDRISSADPANKGADSMSEKDLEKAQAEKDEAVAKAEAAEKRAARAEAIAAMDGDVRKHFDSLKDEGARDEFLAKSADERTAEVKAAADADKVVYKSADGAEFRASDDPRLVAMAKARDEDRKEIAKARAEAKDADIEKRAAELTHIPGDLEARKSMIKALDAIEDEEARKKAHEALKAQDAELGKAFERVGAPNPAEPTEGSPQAELDKMAKAYAKEHDVSEAVAMRKVSETPQGAALYEKTLN